MSGQRPTLRLRIALVLFTNVIRQVKLFLEKARSCSQFLIWQILFIRLMRALFRVA